MHKIKNSMKDSIVIVSAKVHGNLCVELTFSDGHKNIVDIGDFIRRHPHPQYNNPKSRNITINRFQVAGTSSVLSLS